MQQYFIDGLIRINETISFDREQSYHIKTVLRMKPNTILRLVDESEKAYLARLEYGDNMVGAHPYALDEIATEMNCNITLIQGMIKGEKWDWLLQKASELGVHTIVPLLSARTVVKSKEEKLDKKLIRWNKITLEACEQSKRNHQTKVTEPITVQEIEQYRNEANFIAFENANAKSENLKEKLSQVNSLTIIIGPEGGFEEQEIIEIEGIGFKRCSLGTRILRAETAALFSLSVIQTMLK